MRQAALGAAAARPAAPVRFVARVPACNHPHRRNPFYLRQHFQPGTTDHSGMPAREACWRRRLGEQHLRSSSHHFRTGSHASESAVTRCEATERLASPD